MDDYDIDDLVRASQEQFARDINQPKDARLNNNLEGFEMNVVICEPQEGINKEDSFQYILSVLSKSPFYAGFEKINKNTYSLNKKDNGKGSFRNKMGESLFSRISFVHNMKDMLKKTFYDDSIAESQLHFLRINHKDVAVPNRKNSFKQKDAKHIVKYLGKNNIDSFVFFNENLGGNIAAISISLYEELVGECSSGHYSRKYKNLPEVIYS